MTYYLYSNKCEPGYYGSDCSSVCPGGAKTPCFGGGTCSQGTGGDGSCTCYKGFSGQSCQKCASGYYGNDCEKCSNCGNHGSCEDTKHGDGSCDCYVGWAGSNCNKCDSGYWGSNCDQTCPDGNGYNNVCNGHGTCNDGIDGDGTCTCDRDWTSDPNNCNGRNYAPWSCQSACSYPNCGSCDDDCTDCKCPYCFEYPNCHVEQTCSTSIDLYCGGQNDDGGGCCYW